MPFIHLHDQNAEGLQKPRLLFFALKNVPVPLKGTNTLFLLALICPASPISTFETRETLPETVLPCPALSASVRWIIRGMGNAGKKQADGWLSANRPGG